MRKEYSITALRNQKQTILTTLFIGLTYLWTGTAYLSWTNHLTPLASSFVSYLATEVGDCLTQIAGLILLFMILDGFCFMPVVFSDEMMPVLIWDLR